MRSHCDTVAELMKRLENAAMIINMVGEAKVGYVTKSSCGAIAMVGVPFLTAEIIQGVGGKTKSKIGRRAEGLKPAGARQTDRARGRASEVTLK